MKKIFGSNATPLCMHYAVPLASKAISSAQTVDLRKIASISTIFMQHEATFTNSVKDLLSYSRAVYKLYIVQFSNILLTCRGSTGQGSRT